MLQLIEKELVPVEFGKAVFLCQFSVGSILHCRERMEIDGKLAFVADDFACSLGWSLQVILIQMNG